MGHTTFVLAKNILTWTDCTENKRSRLCPNLILSRNGCSHLYFVERRGAWVQSWAYLGRGLRVQNPQMIFFTIQKLKIYKTIKAATIKQTSVGKFQILSSRRLLANVK